MFVENRTFAGTCVDAKGQAKSSYRSVKIQY